MCPGSLWRLIIVSQRRKKRKDGDAIWVPSVYEWLGRDYEQQVSVHRAYFLGYYKGVLYLI